VMWHFLVQWITQRSGKAPPEKPALLYTATVDGFDCQSFITKCYGKQRLLTVFRNQAGYVFGGFTVNPITSGWVNDNQAFLFTLVNHQARSPQMFPCSNAKAGEAVYGVPVGSNGIIQYGKILELLN
jgi:hypothetical protein